MSQRPPPQRPPPPPPSLSLQGFLAELPFANQDEDDNGDPNKKENALHDRESASSLPSAPHSSPPTGPAGFKAGSSMRLSGSPPKTLTTIPPATGRQSSSRRRRGSSLSNHSAAASRRSSLKVRQLTGCDFDIYDGSRDRISKTSSPGICGFHNSSTYPHSNVNSIINTIAPSSGTFQRSSSSRNSQRGRPSIPSIMATGFESSHSATPSLTDYRTSTWRPSLDLDGGSTFFEASTRENSWFSTNSHRRFSTSSGGPSITSSRTSFYEDDLPTDSSHESLNDKQQAALEYHMFATEISASDQPKTAEEEGQKRTDIPRIELSLGPTADRRDSYGSMRGFGGRTSRRRAPPQAINPPMQAPPPMIRSAVDMPAYRSHLDDLPVSRSAFDSDSDDDENDGKLTASLKAWIVRKGNGELSPMSAHSAKEEKTGASRSTSPLSPRIPIPFTTPTPTTPTVEEKEKEKEKKSRFASAVGKAMHVRGRFSRKKEVPELQIEFIEGGRVI